MKFLLSGITIGIILLLATAPLPSSVTLILAQPHDNTVEQNNVESAEDIEEGSSTTNFARNLAEFTDSSFNILTQSNDQNVEDISDESFASNTGINDAGFVGSDNNVVDQQNGQSAEDVTDDSKARNVGLNNAEFSAAITRPIGDPIGGRNECPSIICGIDIRGSDNNEVSQSNNQEIENVEDGSEASNFGANNAQFLPDSGRGGEPGPPRPTGNADNGCGLGCGGVPRDGGSENNEVSQSNDQDIEEVEDESEASNSGVNNAEFVGSDNNDLGQNNDQEIQDVEDGSLAGNDAENTVSFDGDDGGTTPPEGGGR